MVGNMVSIKILTLLSISLFLILLPQIVISDDCRQTRICLDKAVDRILEIRSLPEKTHLHTLMAALSVFLSTYLWGCDFVIRIAPGMKNVVSFAQPSCNLSNMRLISGRQSATHTSGVENHPQFCRKHHKNCSVVWYFLR
jgi:hypothetical protein